MHELSLCEALFDQIDAAVASQTSPVVRLVRLRVGELAGLEPELFRSAFEVTRADRGHPSAELVITFETALWTCRACGAEIARGEALRCAACGGDARLAKGGDMVLERIELEVPDV